MSVLYLLQFCFDYLGPAGSMSVVSLAHTGSDLLRMLYNVSSDYWYVGNQHSFSWKTMPLYLNVTHMLPIVQCRCFLGHYVHYGIAGALSTDFRQVRQK